MIREVNNMSQKIFHRFLSLLEYKKEYQLKSSALNYTQLHVLEEIYKNKEIKTLEISKLMDISPSTLIGVLDELEKKGLITRERQKNDKRVVVVSATEAGSSKVEQHFTEDKSFLKNLTASLSQEEKQQFFQLMKKITDSIDQPEKLFIQMGD